MDHLKIGKVVFDWLSGYQSIPLLDTKWPFKYRTSPFNVCYYITSRGYQGP
jgi:hypothetical protein